MIIYDEDAAKYHAHAATGSGDIRNLIDSPPLYVDGRAGLCDRKTKALLFGTASHTFLLEPGAYAQRVAVQPKHMSLARADGQAWAARFAQGKAIITEKDAAHLGHMAKRMPAAVRSIFDRCRKEATVRTMLGELEAQARPDLWDLDAAEFFDLKSIDSLSGGERALSKTIAGRGYHVQLAWYRRVLEAETGREHTGRLIFVEKVPPYRWRIVAVDPDFDAIGDVKVDDALSEIAARTKSGCWEDRDALEITVAPPEWAEAPIVENAEGGMDL